MCLEVVDAIFFRGIAPGSKQFLYALTVYKRTWKRVFFDIFACEQVVDIRVDCVKAAFLYQPVRSIDTVSFLRPACLYRDLVHKTLLLYIVEPESVPRNIHGAVPCKNIINMHKQRIISLAEFAILGS